MIRRKNEFDNEIARLLNRPAQLGHAVEFIAARIFIWLYSSSMQAHGDGKYDIKYRMRKDGARRRQPCQDHS